MKPFEQRTHRVILRSGIIAFAAMVVLAFSSMSARRVGVALASVIDMSSATVAAAENNGIRPFQFHAPDEALAGLRRRIAISSTSSTSTAWATPRR